MQCVRFVKMSTENFFYQITLDIVLVRLGKQARILSEKKRRILFRGRDYNGFTLPEEFDLRHAGFNQTIIKKYEKSPSLFRKWISKTGHIFSYCLGFNFAGGVWVDLLHQNVKW